MKDNLDVHIVGANRIDVVLNVAHGATVFLVLVAADVVDMVNDFLLPIALTGIRAICQKNNRCQRRNKDIEYAHVILPISSF
jgi:hypothetical protein